MNVAEGCSGLDYDKVQYFYYTMKTSPMVFNSYPICMLLPINSVRQNELQVLARYLQPLLCSQCIVLYQGNIHIDRSASNKTL